MQCWTETSRVPHHCVSWNGTNGSHCLPAPEDYTLSTLMHQNQRLCPVVLTKRRWGLSFNKQMCFLLFHNWSWLSEKILQIPFHLTMSPLGLTIFSLKLSYALRGIVCDFAQNRRQKTLGQKKKSLWFISSYGFVVVLPSLCFKIRYITQEVLKHLLLKDAEELHSQNWTELMFLPSNDNARNILYEIEN